MELRPIRFIGDPIEVAFDREPLLEKKQGCPDRFRWQGESFEVVEMLRSGTITPARVAWRAICSLNTPRWQRAADPGV